MSVNQFEVWNQQERFERLLRSKRSFSELQVQKGECVIPCDEQLRSSPSMSEQESSQAKQMDRGETEVEEESRVRMKRVHVLPTDEEKDENENMHAGVSQPARNKIPASV